MDTVRRLMWFAVGVLLAAGPMIACASSPLPGSVSFAVVRWGGATYAGSYATPAEACNAMVSEAGKPSSIGGWSDTYKNYPCFNKNAYQVGNVGYSCPSGYEGKLDWGSTRVWFVPGACAKKDPAGSRCIPPEVYDSASNTCRAPCPPGTTWDSASGICKSVCEAGSTKSSGYYDIGSSPNPSPGFNVACDGTCELVMSGSVAARALVGGEYHYYFRGEYQRTGGACSSPTALDPSASVPPDTCGAGQGSASMNGKTVCVDMNTGEPSSPHPDKPAPTPKTTTKDTTKSTNPDGSETTTETTNHPDGSQTIKTTVRYPDGSGTETTTQNPAPGGGSSGGGSGGGQPGQGSGEGDSDDPAQDFCKANPDADLCKEKEGKFSGTCQAFDCVGDAVECAIAKATNQMNCAFSSSDGQSLAEKIISGNDPAFAEKNPFTKEVRAVNELSVASSSGTCPSDVHLSVMGRSAVIPLADKCGVLQLMGQILVGLAWLSAFYLVSRSIT